jgi:hypothetical protein
MAIACKFCLLPGGQGVSFSKGNIFETQEELNDHIENEHDIAVQREDESMEEAQKRFEAKNKRAGTDECRCPSCVARRASQRTPTS